MKSLHRYNSIIVFVGLFIVGITPPSLAAEMSGSLGALAASYLPSQAANGKALFANQCVNCHLAKLSGSDFVPPLAGNVFIQKWKDKSPKDLIEKIRDTMPPYKPKSISDTSAADLAAFILQANGVPVGKTALAAVPTGSEAPYAPTPASSILVGPSPLLDALVPVTDAALQNPDPADWINWRRTLDGWGFSPLKQIDRTNVSKLQLAWSWSMPAGEVQPTPLVYKGVMYLSNATGVQALNAANGDLLWEFKEQTSGSRRNIAIYQDKIHVNTRSGSVVALDIHNGAVIWKSKVADPAGKGYGFSSGGIIVNGKLISGLTSCGKYKDDTCYIIALDANTGKELWRTSTVARVGEPGGKTWGDRENMFRAGSEAWMPGSYDPGTNLIYWGTAQAKPWARVQRGSDGAALYSSSTLALDPDTGKIVWYYQHIPGESHDEDEVFTPILTDTGGRKTLFKMGKIGVLWELDRTNGKFLGARDLGYQTLLTIDPKTGKTTYKPGVLPAKFGDPVEYCPGPGGFKNLWEMSYHPETDAFYIPIKLSCVRTTFDEVPLIEGGGGNGPVTRTPLPHPQSPTQLGEFLAMDKTGKVLWRHRNRTPYDTAALTTAGGLAFVGDMDRHFSAFDVKTGEVLWETRLVSSAEGFPVTFSVNGRQYVAITSGPGPAFIMPDVETLLPGLPRATAGMAIQVFALPDVATK